VDLGTIIGSTIGWLLLLAAILVGGAGVGAYVDFPSVLIVGGGTTAAALVAYPLRDLKRLPSVLQKTLKDRAHAPLDAIRQFVEFAEIARRDGILSLESKTEEIEDEFIVRGIQMAVDGTDPQLIEAILEAELENQVLRHQQGKALFDTLGRYSPAFGMIGTLVGLVAMLANMEDPSAIGAGMAAALLTTLYGAILANLVFLPMADKLGRKAAVEVLHKTIIIQGIMSIQAGDNPRVVEQKLLAYVPPSKRPDADDAAAAAA